MGNLFCIPKKKIKKYGDITYYSFEKNPNKFLICDRKNSRYYITSIERRYISNKSIFY